MVERSRSRKSMAFVVTLLLTGVPISGTPALSAQQGGDRDGHLNRAVDLLRGDQAIFGIISGDRSSQNARSLARSDLDFIIIDMEHGPWDPETLRIFLLGMVDPARIAASGSTRMGVTPVVRVPQNGSEMMTSIVKQALDMGAFGIMFPMIDNRGEALNAIRSMRYPRPTGSPVVEPRGLRGRSPGIASWFWGVGGGEYFERADVWPLDPAGDLLAVIQIESPEAVENIDEIATTPGVGVLFLGPMDLATQMGYGDDLGNPAVEEAIQTVLAACLEHDVPCAITTSAGTVSERLEQGFRVVTVGADGGMTAGTAQALEVGRAAAGRPD